MKKIILTLIIFPLWGTGGFAQTAKEIIDKNIELSGGLANWKRLNSVVLSGNVTLGINDKFPITIYQQRPNLTKTTIVIDKKENTIEGFDGKKGYAMNYAANKIQENPDYVPEGFDSDFMDWENKGFTAKYLGKEKAGSTNCHKIELSKNSEKTYYYFSVSDFMLLKEEKKDETLIYSDYRKIGNLQFPFRIESSSATKDSDYVILLYKIETNKTLPANTFKF